MHNRELPPRVLTIAGSDSGGGAGIQADLKTIIALGGYGMSAIASVTAQNTLTVAGIHDLPPDFVALQIDLVAQDIGVDAAKTGMLSNAEIIRAVAAAIQRNAIPNLVVDPVMVAKSGDALLRADACDALINELLPLAKVVTPNLPEAEVISGTKIQSPDDVLPVARMIHAMGPEFVLIKGGHWEEADPVDYLYDGTGLIPFPGKRIDTRNTHGTGCTFSAAIATLLARGLGVEDAVGQAKGYLLGAIRNSMALGHGHGPLNHAWNLVLSDMTSGKLE
jgi:hydroxymethylpyrimidine/phosphomethylpyrimidine kinase